MRSVDQPRVLRLLVPLPRQQRPALGPVRTPRLPLRLPPAPGPLRPRPPARTRGPRHHRPAPRQSPRRSAGRARRPRLHPLPPPAQRRARRPRRRSARGDHRRQRSGRRPDRGLGPRGGRRHRVHPRPERRPAPAPRASSTTTSSTSTICAARTTTPSRTSRCSWTTCTATATPRPYSPSLARSWSSPGAGARSVTRPRIEQERRTWRPAGTRVDVLSALRDWFEPLLRIADRICAGVGGEVRRWDGEPCRYRFRFERDLVERLIADHQVDWVNSLLLGMRFTTSPERVRPPAHRPSGRRRVTADG